MTRRAVGLLVLAAGLYLFAGQVRVSWLFLFEALLLGLLAVSLGLSHLALYLGRAVLSLRAVLGQRAQLLEAIGLRPSGKRRLQQTACSSANRCAFMALIFSTGLCCTRAIRLA